MKQYRYDASKIKKNYLASYSDAILKENLLCLVNTLTDRQIIIKNSHSRLVHFVMKLEKGVSDEELLNLLSEFGAQDYLKILLREGLIE